DPIQPSIWASLTAKASVSHTGGSYYDDFLFDTGAQVSVISQDTAAHIGISQSTTPDFYVEVAGVGGNMQVRGYYINSLSVTVVAEGTTSFSWTHVPMLVLDLPDPRDGTGYIPGLLGMNLFTDRDLIVNGGTTAQWVGISPI